MKYSFGGSYTIPAKQSLSVLCKFLQWPALLEKTYDEIIVFLFVLLKFFFFFCRENLLPHLHHPISGMFHQTPTELSALTLASPVTTIPAHVMER